MRQPLKLAGGVEGKKGRIFWGLRNENGRKIGRNLGFFLGLVDLQRSGWEGRNGGGCDWLRIGVAFVDLCGEGWIRRRIDFLYIVFVFFAGDVHVDYKR